MLLDPRARIGPSVGLCTAVMRTPGSRGRALRKRTSGRIPMQQFKQREHAGKQVVR